MQNVIQKDRYSAGLIQLLSAAFAKYLPFGEVVSYFYSFATGIFSLALKLYIYSLKLLRLSFQYVLQVLMQCSSNFFPL